MPKIGQAVHWKLWTGITMLVLVGVVSGGAYMTFRRSPSAQASDSPKNKGIPVKFTQAKKGVLERLSTQPGSVQAYESVNLYAKVPGFLKKQKVDIGDRVKEGEILAVVDVPEF